MKANEPRHIIRGDLGWLEYAIADYIAKWGTQWTGQPYLGEFGPNIAGLPCAVANMAMTVIRQAIVASWQEEVVLEDDTAPLESLARGQAERASSSHDFPGCDPSVDCKFVGPRDCLCSCHAGVS